MTKRLCFAKNAQASVLQRMPKRRAESPLIAPAIPPQPPAEEQPILGELSYCTQVYRNKTWQTICHYSDYMEAHKIMRRWEEDSHGFGEVFRVSHTWSYYGYGYKSVHVREPLTAAEIRASKIYEQDDD